MYYRSAVVFDAHQNHKKIKDPKKKQEYRKIRKRAADWQEGSAARIRIRNHKGAKTDGKMDGGCKGGGLCGLE